MNQSRTRRLAAGSVVVTLLAGLLTLLALAPAQANHGDRTLQASPEIGFAPAGTPITVTATLSSAATEASGPIEVDAEVESGVADFDGPTPAAPDTGCVVAVGASTCTFTVSASVAGQSEVRLWIDHDKQNELDQGGVTEADLAEGRLANASPDANPQAGAQTPSAADCRYPEDFGATDVPPVGNYAGCGASLDPSTESQPGLQPEPDGTDVIQLNWTAAKALDCVTPNNTDRYVETGDPTATDGSADIEIRCTYRGPAATLRVDGANISNADGTINETGANDPDETPNGRADYGQQNKSTVEGNAPQPACTTTTSTTTCTITIKPIDAQSGPAILCFWFDGDNDEAFAPAAGGAGTGDDGEGCEDERVGDREYDDSTDRVAVRWGAAPVASALDLSPETQTVAAGGSRSIIATVLDQYGDPFLTSVVVKFEKFAGSVTDADGNDSASPDRSCPTSSGRCAITYGSNASGTDLVCGWFGDAAPVLSGTASTGTCDGESQANDGHAPRIDVVRITWTAAATGTTPTTAAPGGGGGTGGGQTSEAQGYSLVGEEGSLYAFGTAKNVGDMRGKNLNAPIIGVAYTPGGNGYWLVAKDGGIFTFGNAEFHGSMGDKKLNSPVLGMAATPTGNGYWLFAGDGGIFTFGDAEFFGSMGDKKLNQPVINMESIESGNGYWLVAADGGIFTFGDAEFFGSMGDQKINQPVFDMTSTDTDDGYWLIARDGGVFSFGDAGPKFYGSAVNENPRPTRVIGMDSTPGSLGYWVADATGKIYAYGNAQHLGDRYQANNPAPMIGFAAVPGQKL